MSENAQLGTLELPNCVSGNNDEIKKQATVLIRLVKLLMSDGISPEAFSVIAVKYGRKLQGCLDLLAIYQRIASEESELYRAELESVMEGNSALSVRHAIGDVGEEEYKLKKAMYTWDIENLNKKNQLFEGSLNQLRGLSDQLDVKNLEELRLLTDDDCRMIRELELDSRVSDLLRGGFSALIGLIE